MAKRIMTEPNPFIIIIRDNEPVFFEVGDNIKWNDIQRAVRGEEFTGGKTVEEIVKIEPSSRPRETRLWMSNGLHINPECVIKVPKYKEIKS